MFNGKYGVMTDGNGLYYMRARYYNPEIKRFVNRDVYDGSIDDGQSLNRYAYANGNPVSYNDPFGLCVNSDDSKPNLLSQGLDAVSGGIKWGTDKLTQGVDWIDLNVFGGQANILTAQVNLNLGAVQSLSITTQGILTLVAHPVKTTANVLAIFEYDPVRAPVVMPQRIPIKIKDEVLLSIGNAIDQGVQDFNTADTNHKLRTTGFIVGEIGQFFIPITKASKAKYASEAGKTAEEMKYLGEVNNLSKVSFSEMMDVSQLRLLQNMDVQQTTKYVEDLKRLKETANATKAVKASTGTAEALDNAIALAKYEEMSSGAVIKKFSELSVDEWLRLEDLARTMYNGFRNRTDDIAKIAKNTGWDEEKIIQIKNHLFNEEHLFQDGTRRTFDPNYWQAEAWERLINGTATDTDMLLLNHELFELTYMKANNCVYEIAHAEANKLYNWSKALFGE